MATSETHLPSAEPNTAGDSKTPRTPGSGGKRKGPRRNRKSSPGATLVADDEDEDDRQLEILDKLIGLSLNPIPSIDVKATSAKTPAPVLEKLRVGLAKVTAQPELRQRLEKGGWRMMGMSVAEAESYARAEADKWTRFLKQAGISGD